MKTLADMSAEERAECVGLWAETSNGLAIIIEPFYTDGALDTTVAFSLKPEVKIAQYVAAYVTPRPDLPRAWMPDGQPPAGKWEDDYTDSDGITLTTGEDLDLGPYQEVRRWIGDWEEA
nr:MAG TPA: hypothetical protein [Caudoviricetes sp.]